MSRKLKTQATPSMIVALLALVIALGGTAIAATGVLSGKQKKQVGKIATKVFAKNIGGASVSHASSADIATQATKANTATKANEATKATTATKATEATKADTATKANEATKAGSANTATTAAKATDADELGGVPASGYQRPLTEQCVAPYAISTIKPDGEVTCDRTSIRAIDQVTVAATLGGIPVPIELPDGIQLLNSCHDGGQTAIHFQNLGANASLNWFYGDGAGTSAGGTTVPPEKTFSYAGGRIEGQFIWTDTEIVVTLNLHVQDGGGTCEITGTVVSAYA